MGEFIVLSKSKRIVKLSYELIKKLPKEEKYVLIPQILRSAISIPSNITEGNAREGQDYIRFLKIARGSLNELKVQLEIVFENYKLKNDELFNLIEEVQKITYSLILKLKTQNS